jgi:hypothetical protein
MRKNAHRIRHGLFVSAVAAALAFGARSAAADAKPAASALLECGIQQTVAACADCCGAKGAGGAHLNPTTKRCTCIF